MYNMRESWTDERLDDLNAKVDRGFHRVDSRFVQMDERLDVIQRTMILGFVGLFGAQVTLFGIALAVFTALR